MALTAGTRIGPYEITGAIGAGGMGEVYRARDTRLDRDVAIKILPEIFVSDAERLSRFEREAKTLASLNHTNIAQIYGTEQLGNVHALAMEFVDGQDLAERLARGAVPLEDAMLIARQIAEALEAAHEQGIIHRDLKPANVKVRPDGTVKVLDFGLAKALTAEGSAADPLLSPTFTSPVTQMGVILGTAAYMAPEQAKGKPVDRRADIWAFGVLLHELLSGRQLWAGETASETLAHVMMRDADLTTLPAETPPRLRSLIARCLVKDPKSRLRDIGEARVALTEILSGDAAIPGALPVASSTWRRLAWMAAAATLAALGFVALWLRTPATDAAPPLTASLAPPAGMSHGGSFALSPDGTRLVFGALNRENAQGGLFLRDLTTGTVVPIANTASAVLPFWSPDGRQIGFFAEGKLKRLNLQDGSGQALADVETPRGGAWTLDGRIVFAPNFRTGLWIVDAKGGAPSTLTTVQANQRSHRWPAVLPDGRHIVFLSQQSEGGAPNDASTIEAIALDGTNRRTLVTANSSPLYAAPGFLMFWRDRLLMAQRFDAGGVSLTGDAIVIAQDVAYDPSEMVLASVSSTGRLVYLPGGTNERSSLYWLDRAGRRLGVITGPAVMGCGLALSPDGKRLAVGHVGSKGTGCDMWVHDLERGTPMRLSFEESDEYSPVWSADGRDLLMVADLKVETIVRRDASGRGKPAIVFESAISVEPLAVSRDGTWLLMMLAGQKTAADIVRYDFAAKKVTPLVQSQFTDAGAALSPDERWIAYVSDRSGTSEVYVEPAVAGEGGLWQVSVGGGTAPLWRRDGRELFFLRGRDQLMSVDVSAGDTFRSGVPREVFRAPFVSDYGAYAVGPDGQKFIGNLADESQGSRMLTIVSDWLAPVKK